MALPRGTIADIEARLMLWAIRESADLVRVEFVSEFSRQKVWQTVRTGLMEHGVNIHEVILPVQSDPEMVVKTLIDRLAELPPGVVSITGFARAFNNNVSLPEAQAILNFNRDRYIHPGLRQVWWMTPTFLHSAVHTMLDLNSWFSYKLQLTEVLPLANEEITSEPMDLPGGVYANISDAYQRAHRLLLRFREAQAVETGEDLNLLIAVLYCYMGRYTEAEGLLRRAIAIRENKLGLDHPDTISSRQSLANLKAAVDKA